MTCAAPTQSYLWHCTPASLGSNVGFRPISSGHQGFCNTRKRWLTLYSLFLVVWYEMLLKSVEWHCYKTRYNRAGKYLNISNVDKVNNVNANRVQSRTGFASIDCTCYFHCHFVIFRGIITIKLISQLLKPKHIPLSFGVGIKSTLNAEMVSFEMGHYAPKAYQVPIRRVTWRLGDWKHWLQQINFFLFFNPLCPNTMNVWCV